MHFVKTSPRLLDGRALRRLLRSSAFVASKFDVLGGILTMSLTETIPTAKFVLMLSRML